MIDDSIIKYRDIPDRITNILCSEVKERDVVKNFWKIRLVNPTANEIIEPLNRVLNHGLRFKRSPPMLAKNDVNIAMKGANKDATAKFKASETDTSMVFVFFDG